MATAILGPRQLQEVNWNLLQDPRISPRLKALLVSLESFHQLHLLTLRAHDLLSIAHVHRVDRIPEQLYRLFEDLRSFERRFSTMLFRIHQYPEVLYVVFFAKTFSDRSFECGRLQRILEQTLERSLQTRQAFKSQMQDAERDLRRFEEDIYARQGIFQVTNSSQRRSRAQKVFLPQPHALEYLPVTIELYHDRTNRGEEMFSVPVTFLRNRRSQLEASLEQINETRNCGQFDSVDLRDFRHEFELLESELQLVSNLQRLLTNVRMMEEVSSGNRSISNIPSGTQVFSALFQEASDVLQSMNRTNFEHRGSEMSASQSRPMLLADADALTTRRNVSGPPPLIPLVDPLTGLRVSSARERARDREMRPSSENRTSELARATDMPSWMISSDNLSTSGGRRVNPRGRWALQGFEPFSSEDNVRRPHDVTSERNYDTRTSGPGRITNINNDNFRSDVISSGRSAFHPIQRVGTSSNDLQAPDTRARSSNSFSDFSMNLNHGNGAELNYDNLENTFNESSEAHSELLRELMSKVEDVNHLVICLNSSMTAVTAAFDVIEDMRQSIGEIRQDVAAIKGRVFGPSAAEVASVNHTIRNPSDELWRNLDSSPSSRRTVTDRPHMNISNRNWESPRSETRLPETSAGDRITRRFNFSPNSETCDDAPIMSSRTDHCDIPRSLSGMLNNQVAPGNRANNYWDNFKSYSRLNLLSDSKTNIPVLSPSGVVEDHIVCPDDVFTSTAAARRRESRGERGPGVSAMRSSLSANFVENIGHKKRNKDQKMQFQQQQTSGSPANSTSSNSSATGSFRDIFTSTRREPESNDMAQLGASRDVGMEPTALPHPSAFQGARAFVTSAAALEQSLEEVVVACANVQISSLSPVSSLEVDLPDLVSRDEFMQLNSGAGSSAASGNGRSDDGGPSSSSSKKELEKILAPDKEDRPGSSNNHLNWSLGFQNGAWSDPSRNRSSEAEAEHDSEDNPVQTNEASRSRNSENTK